MDIHIPKLVLVAKSPLAFACNRFSWNRSGCMQWMDTRRYYVVLALGYSSKLCNQSGKVIREPQCHNVYLLLSTAQVRIRTDLRSSEIKGDGEKAKVRIGHQGQDDDFFFHYMFYLPNQLYFIGAEVKSYQPRDSFSYLSAPNRKLLGGRSNEIGSESESRGWGMMLNLTSPPDHLKKVSQVFSSLISPAARQC